MTARASLPNRALLLIPAGAVRISFERVQESAIVGTKRTSTRVCAPLLGVVLVLGTRAGHAQVAPADTTCSYDRCAVWLDRGALRRGAASLSSFATVSSGRCVWLRLSEALTPRRSWRSALIRGLALPTGSRLLERGFITFEADGRIRVSPSIPEDEYASLQLSPTMRLRHLPARSLPFLEQHRMTFSSRKWRRTHR